MQSRHIEAILVVKPGGDRHALETWLAGEGFTVARMQAGLLVCGASDLFERIFHVDLSQAVLPLPLPVPAKFQSDVTAFEIPKPPTYHV
jgi:hypothetical protein